MGFQQTHNQGGNEYPTIFLGLDNEPSCFYYHRGVLGYVWSKQAKDSQKESGRNTSDTQAPDAAAVAVTPQPVMQQTPAASVTPPAYPNPSPAQSIAGMASNLNFRNASAPHGTFKIHST